MTAFSNIIEVFNMSNENEKPKKRLVKKTAKRPLIRINEKVLSRKIVVDTDGIKKEVIKSEYTDENGVKKIAIRKIKVKDNPKIKSATDSVSKEAAEDSEKNDNSEKDGIKKITRNKSKQRKFWDKYGVAIIFTGVFAFFFGLWMYIAPIAISFKVNDLYFEKMLKSKFGLSLDCSGTRIYTTPTLGVGINIKNPKVYFGTNEDSKIDENLYFKAKSVNMEIQAIPYFMKTIKFNSFVIRNLNASIYQDADGKFSYVSNIRNNFNPQMKKIMVYVPDIELKNFAFKKYSDLTGDYKVDSGLEGNIKASVVKEVLQQSDKVTDVMLR